MIKRNFQSGLLAAVLTLLTPLLSSHSFAQQSATQQPPATGFPAKDIFVSKLIHDQNQISIGPAKNLTKRLGYDNQPFFLPDNHTILYTSIGINGKSDIWSIDIKTEKQIRVTSSDTKSEFSPRLSISGDHITVIQENEQAEAQQVYRYSLDGANGTAVLDLNPVGYYAFLRNEEYVAMFALGEPPTLKLANLQSGSIDTIHENIDRALYPLPDRSGFVFTTPNDDNGYSVLHYDLQSKSKQTLFDLPRNARDYAIFEQGKSKTPFGFIAAADGNLYYRHWNDQSWTIIGDLTQLGLTGVTRLAVSDNLEWIAMVADDKNANLSLD